MRLRSLVLAAASSAFAALFLLAPLALCTVQEQRGTEPRCEVTGRVIDESGAPVAGFLVELGSGSAVWREGVEQPAYHWGGYEQSGWRTGTDEEGRFRFELPLPTADWVSLRGRSDPLLCSFDAYFGPAGGRDAPRLVEGLNDLGEFVLAPAAAIRGRLLDEDGAPIANARLSCKSVYESNFRAHGFGSSDADGNYTIGHLPAEPMLVSASADGFRSASSGRPVRLQLGVMATGPDFALSRAYRISGVLVDESGSPLQGVLVGARSVDKLGWGSGRSDDRGHFVIEVDHDGPHVLSIDQDPWITPWGGDGVPEALVGVGRDDLRIVLEWAPRTTVRVRDAVTRDPVPNFRIFGGHLDGYRIRSLLREVSSEAGIAEVPARPGSGAQLWVRASGYVPLRADIEFDDPSGAKFEQTVLLRPAANLSGVLWFDGRPASAVMVEVSPFRFPKDPDVPVEPDDIFGDGWTKDVPDEAAHPRRVSTDASGTFFVDDLSPGTYSVTATSDRTVPLELGPIELGDAEDRKLGRFDLEVGATLAGRLLLAGGVSPVGIRYRVDDRVMPFDWIDRLDGRFEVHGLASGSHRLVIFQDRGRLRVAKEIVREFQVEAGERLELEVDLRRKYPASVVVEWKDSPPPKGAFLELVRLGDDGEPILTDSPPPLSSIDAKGNASGSAPAGVDLVVVARRGPLRLGRSAVFRLDSEEERRVTIAPSYGSVTLELPEDFVLPKKGVLQLRFCSTKESWRPPYGWMHWRAATEDAPSAGVADLVWTGREVAIGELASGEYQVVLVAWSGAGRPTVLIPERELEFVVRESELTVLHAE